MSTIDDTLDEAKNLHRANQLPQAELLYRKVLESDPSHPIANHMLGVLAYQTGQIASAIELAGKAIAVKPHYAEAHSHLGNFLHATGRLREATEHHRRALEIRPDFAEGHNNLGNALYAAGEFSSAEVSYRRALDLKPALETAAFNLGNALRELGRLNEAEEAYRRAIAVNPGYGPAYRNLGDILRVTGRLDPAIEAYQRAISVSPITLNLECKLGFALLARGRGDEALAQSLRCLAISEVEISRDLFVQVVKQSPFNKPNLAVQEIMVRALAEPWTRPNDLAAPACELIAQDPQIAACIMRAAATWPNPPAPGAVFAGIESQTIVSNPLLLALLRTAPVYSLGLEQFLISMRRTMLDEAMSTKGLSSIDPHTLGFYAALAQQAFINEYIYVSSQEEEALAAALRDLLIDALQRHLPAPLIWIAAVAAYFPLHSLSVDDLFLAQRWPNPIDEIVAQQISEPAEERRCVHTIPRLTRIRDEVSQRVQHQYLANPYPRWVKASPVRPTTVDNYLRSSFPLSRVTPLSKDAVDVLIAGCGTGLHPIEQAGRFPNSKALAIDLSMSSLCYAKRKTIDLKLENISYANADIMELADLDRSFDVIEAVGVLHHLADLFSGWRTLLSLLRDNGLMRIGLYSRRGRRNIVRAQKMIGGSGDGITTERIRNSRRDLMALPHGEPMATLVCVQDFFTTSSCRDLLFHTQELRTSIPEIRHFLVENDMRFIGFEIGELTLSRYQSRFPNDPGGVDLDNWEEFEKDHPNTFVSMYQFWIQRGGDPSAKA